MQRRTRTIIAAAALGSAVAAGAGLVAATNGEDGTEDAQEAPIVGTDLERASAAALAHTGQGRVTGTEVGDEESYYEVEVTLDNGNQVDVQLDEQFNIVDEIPDSDAAETGENEG